MTPDQVDTAADPRATADADVATARRLAGEGGDAAADEAVQLADRAITTYLEELGDVASAAQVLLFLGGLEDSRGRTELAIAHLRSAVEGFVVTQDSRAAEAADDLVALLRRSGQEEGVEEFLTWRTWLVGKQDRTAAAGRRRAP